MKTKYFIIYLGVGAAFLAVSLWVFLTGGNNPKAVNAKFKLGGVILLAWSVIATASCTKGPLDNPEGAIDGGEIMCYDPAPSNYVSFPNMNTDPAGFPYLAPGGILNVSIDWASYQEFRLDIHKPDGPYYKYKAGELLLSVKIVLEEGKQSVECKIQYDPLDADYTGYALVKVYGIEKEGQEYPVDEFSVISIVASEN